VEVLRHTDALELEKFLLENPHRVEELWETGNSAPAWFHASVIKLFTSLDMNEDEAQAHYGELIEHRRRLSEQLGREAGLQVTMLDYFFNVTRHLSNPKAVEIPVFEEILKLTKFDYKTGCHNWASFQEVLTTELQRAERHQQSFSLILLDLDNFKEINDRYGHLFGDKVLEELVVVVDDSLRAEDVLGRYGGDEFAILLPHTGRVGARCMGERVKHAVLNAFSQRESHDRRIELTFSAGIATYPFDAQQSEELVRAADRALYRAKELGRNLLADSFGTGESENELSAQERRTSTRYRVHAPNTVALHDKSDMLSVHGRLVDISADGAVLECACSVNDAILNRELALQVEDLAGVSQLDLHGNVVRISQETQDLKLYVGVRFARPLNSTEWQLIRKHGKLEQAHE